MNYLALILLVAGTAQLLWSLHLLHKPESLSSDSLMYKWIYMRWTFNIFRKDSDFGNPKLSRRQIQRYAIIGIFVATFLIVIGLWGMLDAY